MGKCPTIAAGGGDGGCAQLELTDALEQRCNNNSIWHNFVRNFVALVSRSGIQGIALKKFKSFVFKNCG